MYPWNDTSIVSLFYGLEVDSWSLLFACQAFPSFHQAKIFLALLSLRARAGTLAFDLPPHVKTVASLPEEILAMILDQLFRTLYLDCRVETLQPLVCACLHNHDRAASLYFISPIEAIDDLASDALHICGIHCSYWYKCCAIRTSADFDDEDHQRNRDRRRDAAHALTDARQQIVTALSTYGLHLGPQRRPRDRVQLESDSAPFESTTVLGVPVAIQLKQGPKTQCEVTPSYPSASYLHLDDGDGGDIDRAAMTSIRPFRMTELERRRFIRARRIIEASILEGRVHVASKEGGQVEQREKSEPTLLLVHHSCGQWH